MILSILLATFGAGAPSDFDSYFTGRTLRVDYSHVGTAKEEHVSLDRLRAEGEWAGPHTKLVDDSNLGNYRALVRDAATKRVIWSRGFASIYGEWETTDEAKEHWRSIEESQRIPEPKAPIEFALEKRGADQEFRALWSTTIDPSSRFVDRSAIAKQGEIIPLFEHGPRASKVDLLIVGDAYTAAERDKFVADAKRLTDAMFKTEPYTRHANDFNVRLLFLPSNESGISNPRKGVWRDDALGLSFNAFDSDRYVLDFADKRLSEATAQVPSDAMILLFNERKYGGGGIYNLWATCASDTQAAAYIFVHEFGHSFAGLADEYYTSQVAYLKSDGPKTEPWEPNVTALLDPKNLKWKDLVAASTPLPTPWNQKAFDDADLAYQAKRKQAIDAKASEETSEALMREIKATTEPMLAAEKFFGKVGAFEGAAYEAKGLYRPEVDCVMFTRNPTSFCKVCERSIERAIQRYVE